MNEDAEKTVVEFTDTAAKIYSIVFEQFLSSVRKLNRRRDENVFQLQVAKYSEAFKSDLEREAKKSLANYSGMKPRELRLSISEKIRYCLQQFQGKCNAL